VSANPSVFLGIDPHVQVPGGAKGLPGKLIASRADNRHRTGLQSDAQPNAFATFCLLPVRIANRKTHTEVADGVTDAVGLTSPHPDSPRCAGR